MDDITVNYQYKDRVFRDLFGAEERKENLLSLYNALNGTEYQNLDDLEITTIEDAIYMGMKNDVSCIIDNCLSLFEHQSTYNPNMPLRGLLYFGKLYDKFINVNGKNIYSRRLIKIPTPQYYIFYNEEKELPDRTVLRLSDAFETPTRDGECQLLPTVSGAYIAEPTNGSASKLIQIQQARLPSRRMTGGGQPVRGQLSW